MAAMDKAHLGEVIVVDNDSAKSAAAVCSMYDFVKYIHEPNPGIPAARNAALSAASQDSDAIAFVDDDEVVSCSWLTSLVRMAQAKCADVVSGPVKPLFLDSTPNWIIDGGYWQRPTFPDGTRLWTAATNNVLIRAGTLRASGLTFDEELSESGGEDSEFMNRLQDESATFFAADAIVFESGALPERTNARWLFRQ